MQQKYTWDKYASGVLSKEIPACEFVRLACQRHVSDIERSRSDEFNYRFDEASAKRVIDFFCRLKLTKGLPEPKKFIPEPWQQFILASLFGWVRKDNGLRRFRSGHIMVPRKNGKSSMFAGVGLYGLMADGEMGAEVYSAATKKDQAKFIWDAAVEFRRASGNLAQFVKKSVASLYVFETNSKFAPLSSDEDGMDGLNTHIALIDELQNHKTDVVYGRMDTSTAARRQPLILSIATAGVGRNTLCWEKHEYGVKVLNGIFKDDTFFAYLSEADKGDDWEDERTWIKANPNYGVSVNPDDLKRKAEEAKNQPSRRNDFLRLHLDIWTQQETSWMPIEKWLACSFPITVEENGAKRNLDLRDNRNREAIEKSLVGRRPYAGLDLSERGDITALMLVFPPTETDARWTALGTYFVPQEGIVEKVKKDRVRYDIWAGEGRIIATPGNVVDYDFVRAEINRQFLKFRFIELGVDPWNALQLSQQLIGEGVPVVEVQQGYKSLSDPTKELMAWVLDKKLNHLGDPVLAWMAGNIAVAKDPAGNIKPDKAKARDRIDGISALVTAMSRALLRKRSVYMDRGIITL
jgi:phage terminase large subunit-like protein